MVDAGHGARLVGAEGWQERIAEVTARTVEERRILMKGNKEWDTAPPGGSSRDRARSLLQLGEDETARAGLHGTGHDHQLLGAEVSLGVVDHDHGSVGR